MQFVYRVWDALERCNGQPPVYLDAEQIASSCPACRCGTLRIRFLERPEPGMTVTSNANPGCCSLGCTEGAIREVLFG